MTHSTDLQPLHEDMRAWRRRLHQYPETAYEEVETARFVAEKLKSFGLSVHQGLGKTGVVATLSAGDSARKIALRADMDALFIEEKNSFAYKSAYIGKMHACGHDGHTAMLLGAAKYLTENPNFNGTVVFIFQPAEESRAGAKQMIDDGLFEQFPVDAVFGMHNFPDFPVGHFAVRQGPMMASLDCFEIRIKAQATHAAMPHLGTDAIVAVAQVVNALQTIVSRTLDPAEAAVVSVTQVHAGNTWNALPEEAIIRGTYRCFNAGVQAAIGAKIDDIVEGVCSSLGVNAEIMFNPENPGYPVTCNSADETALAVRAAQTVVGADWVNLQPTPSMGSEDFAFMLQQKPGCYVWIGNGSSHNSCLLHNPHYDFNDDILSIGAAYWVTLVETALRDEIVF